MRIKGGWFHSVLAALSILTQAAPSLAQDAPPEVSVYDARHGTTLPGTLARSTGDPATGDAAVDAAFDNATSVRACLADVFGRDSLDDHGLPVTVTVHYLTNYNNAFWNGDQLVLGDGDGQTFSQFAEALDVVANQLGAGVIQYSAALILSGQSGAIAVSTWDIFSAVCEWYADGEVLSPDVWKIGEDVYTPATSGDAIRYMDDPTRDNYSIDHFSKYPQQTEVHGASGIVDNAFYLLSVGGTNRTSAQQVDGIGIENAAHIWYRALTVYFTPNTDFAAARSGALNAASDLFGAGSPPYLAVCRAFAAVGIGGTCDAPTPTPTVPAPTPTSPPPPTAIPSPTPTPLPTATPTTAAPTATPPPTATVTAVPTATPPPTATIPPTATPTSQPTSKDACRDGGWQTLPGQSFKNQGQCIRFVNEHGG